MPNQELEDLEFRLSEHLDWLNDAIHERDRLALDAAWGVHYGLQLHVQYSFVVAIILFAFTVVHPMPWWGVAAAIAAISLVPLFWQKRIWRESNRLRLGEIESLAKLPTWRKV